MQLHACVLACTCDSLCTRLVTHRCPIHPRPLRHAQVTLQFTTVNLTEWLSKKLTPPTATVLAQLTCVDGTAVTLVDVRSTATAPAPQRAAGLRARRAGPVAAATRGAAQGDSGVQLTLLVAAANVTGVRQRLLQASSSSELTEQLAARGVVHAPTLSFDAGERLGGVNTTHLLYCTCRSCDCEFKASKAQRHAQRLLCTTP